MHGRKLWSSLVVGLNIGFLPFAANAMDLPHHDLDSLVYLSTDIVIADLSVNSQHKITATVTDTLHGSLRPGEKLATLSEFLNFFDPLEDGQRVILFLDSRPRQPNFLFPEASKSPFAVVPSGVYLIDRYQHIHEYYQQNNPGPYVAEGYRFLFDRRLAPTKEQDLAFPSLSDVEARIPASVRFVQSIRPLLDKTATRDEAPAFMNLLGARSSADIRCCWQTKDVIAERLVYQLRSLNDPQLLLRIYPIAACSFSALEFVQTTAGNADKEFTAARVAYLIQTLSNPRNALPLRVASANILLDLSKIHSGSQSGPAKVTLVDNAWLASFAGDIRATARKIFDRKSQNTRLRALCVQLLPLDEPEIVARIKTVYARSKSEELRFAIEGSFLDSSDVIYGSLNPPGGPVASLVRVAAPSDCLKPAAGKIAFVAEYRERQDFFDRFILGLRHTPGSPKPPPQSRYFVMTNARTGQRIVFAKFHQLWNAGPRGGDWIELNQRSGFPKGTYSLALEYSRGGEIVSSGYKLKLTVINTRGGRKLSVK